MFPPLPWPEASNYGNGILHADYTTFNNCKRIVELIAFQPSENSSYIRNCIQNGSYWGITNWNCQNVEVSDNVFNNTIGACIVTDAGSFRIVGNEFHSGENDILFASTSAGFHSTIEDNDFYGSNTGIRAIGTTIGRNEIRNNRFFTGFFDMFMDGDNNYLAEFNNFTGPYGVITISNGGHPNEVRNNDFTGNWVGIMTVRDNENYTFVENCFSTSFYDAFVYGGITEVVGNGEPASNCFTHIGNPSSTTINIGGNPEPFTYWEPFDNQINCLDAILAHPNVQILKEGFANIILCGSNGGTPQIDPCNPNKTINDAIAAKYWLENELTTIQNNHSLPPQEKAGLLNANNRCLNRVTGLLFELYLKDEQFNTARNLYTGDDSDDAKVAIYGSFIHENDLQSARNFLNGLSAGSQGLNDFKTVQLINLERLQAGPDYTADAPTLSAIQNIAYQEHPYASYAKSLYFALTEELISSDIPDIFGQQANVITDNNHIPVPKIRVYPNPFDDRLFIDMDKLQDADITITDVLGETVYQSVGVNFSRSITTSTWSYGPYIVSIVRGDEMVFQAKYMHID